MNHDHYRNLILDEEPITPQEQADLDQHLQSCEECARLSRALHKSLNIISSAPEVQAPQGFTRNWLVEFERRKRAQERKQARTLIIALSSGILVVVLAALIIFLPEFSLISLTAGLITTVVQLAGTFERVWTFLVSLFQSTRPSTLVFTLFILVAWILLACFTLGLSVWKLAIKKIEVKK